MPKAAKGATDADVISTVTVQPQDLTAIEGIGPKIEEVLQAGGINTYAKLAAISPERLRQILSDAGIGADPASWPEQATLAAAGEWDDLKSFQDQLKGGQAK